MLTNKDFEICIKALKKEESTEEIERTINKLELVIEAEKIKKESENKMIEINSKLREIFEIENKKGE